MEYVVEIRPVKNPPHFPFTIGILQRPKYESINGSVKIHSRIKVINYYPGKFIEILEEKLKNPLTVFDAGRAYTATENFTGELQGLFESLIQKEDSKL
jgi:hypothetical protein